MVKQLGFIGLGNMGAPMALNLITAGYQLHVYDLDADKVNRLVTAGAKSVASIAELASTVDLLFTSLPSPDVIEKLAFAEEGLIASLASGTIWVELSTNSLEVARNIRNAADNKAIAMLDAPVSGGTEGAAAATLTIMVGGSKQTFDTCLPFLQVLGNDIRLLGDYGAGYTAKIAQVVLCYLHSVALSEALMLGVKGGVDADTMLAIIEQSTGTSYVARRYGRPLLEGSYDPGFTLDLAHKDMRLTLELAQSVGAALPMCQLVESIYNQAKQTYGGEQNHLMALRVLEDSNSQLLRTHNTQPGE